METNKIVSKTMRSHAIKISATALIILAIVVVFNIKPDLLRQKHQTENNPVRLFNIACASLFAYFLIFSLIPLYKNGNEFAAEFTKKYLEKAMRTNSELSRFKSVLENPEAMKKIATIVSNELRDSEQKRIIELINKIKFNSTEEQIKQIHEGIAKIIAEHALIHPEFLEHIYGALTNADYMMYVKQKQQENKIKTR